MYKPMSTSRKQQDKMRTKQERLIRLREKGTVERQEVEGALMENVMVWKPQEAAEDFVAFSPAKSKSKLLNSICFYLMSVNLTPRIGFKYTNFSKPLIVFSAFTFTCSQTNIQLRRNSMFLIQKHQ